MEYEGEIFHLTEYQIKKSIKAFNYLDKKKKGLLKFDLLGNLLRCCGYNVSLKEIEKIKEKIIEMKIIEKKKEQKSNEEVEKREKDIIIYNENDELSNNNQFSQNDITNDDNNNISQLLSNLKNYDNFIEIEKKKEEIKKEEEKNKNLFSLKEYFRIIQIPNITNEIKPPNILDAFEIFDEQGNGKISIKKLRFILQYLGEPFSNSEFDEFFEWIKTLDKVYKNDYIIYEDLLNELINKDSNI
ncbi:calmodulin, putative [Plasmodium gallinaceum]|uniref:Calmodulin n=1 Tax=Plasmodium gallinaceum TaxID=5849 RepID=A0A1J1GYG9_PLAGA|nr:calmodulin, putative [Plasmodium gallinaceum]CRG97618.1 calmodulin, putative [Plasmodium gallinaceum]